MFPLLHPGDTVLYDRLAYRWGRVMRGDLVVFRHESSPSGRMIKIVVGLPGERIAVQGDALWVNGRRVEFHTAMVGSLPGRWDVGEGQLFVVSYAVAVGTDSRVYGPIGVNRILGRAWFVLPPSPRAGRIERLSLPLEDGDPA